MSIPSLPIVSSFLLCRSATITDDGTDITCATQQFESTLPIRLNFCAFIAFSNGHKTQRVFITISDAATEHEGLRSAPLDVDFTDPTHVFHLKANFEHAEFPSYGKYVARLISEDSTELSQISFEIVAPTSSRSNRM